ncbi:MAG: hypothetical protein R3B07_21815 [Polyangiaceae bacterium]
MWLVLSILSFICGCGILAVIPIALSIVALVKREQEPKLALTLNRFAMGCVIASWVFFLAIVIFQIVVAVSASP